MIGRTVRRFRATAQPKISQEDLCGRMARFGVLLTRTQVAKIEAGKRPVFDYEVLALSRALKINLNQVFGVRGD